MIPKKQCETLKRIGIRKIEGENNGNKKEWKKWIKQKMNETEMLSSKMNDAILCL